ncbi:UspA domain-containing protein [Stanieria cyanosphaera PCC 7437]|uniref:Universal stress protein n=1 Tax=Stanieria cyanosphaera (strain ATCC 29371 / PCC 7437) TaxID=111780 RepID=K9XQL1_STAC7|nr:universal stress protein [Stanieria cyanosphaera]AFZ34905.1 UspA domain-containing protein [Stanieria cyanosphaera PCC 7437]
MENILIAIDFSDITAKVIETGAKIAASCGSKLWLIHVAEPDPDFVGFETGPQSKRDWRAKTFREEHRLIQTEANKLSDRGLDVTPLLIQGVTVETIIQEANKLQADLIVLGSHGHNVIYKTFMGSVSEGVLTHAACPVLLVPSKMLNL